jgi:hypothetical protein
VSTGWVPEVLVVELSASADLLAGALAGRRGSRWSARSEARTNDLDDGVERRRLGQVVDAGRGRPRITHRGPSRRGGDGGAGWAAKACLCRRDRSDRPASLRTAVSRLQESAPAVDDPRPCCCGRRDASTSPVETTSMTGWGERRLGRADCRFSRGLIRHPPRHQPAEDVIASRLFWRDERASGTLHLRRRSSPCAVGPITSRDEVSAADARQRRTG